ncbi:recombinase family protein [Parasedimentitalea marina]|uniref:recombinase family protein n=1 Tax=Parasedimentitalea marina TaxID=2483033 RepID=UPI0026C00E84
MTKVAIYARYSSDLQSQASIEDQIRLCEERAQANGHTVVQCYTDHATSGASLMRPGIQMLMQDAAAGDFSIVMSEALDRISRDQEDIAAVLKRLSFAGIQICTLSEGEISQLHIGLKGTMNALFLKDLANKTRRGLRGRVEKGRSGGRKCYGYDSVQGEERGKRIINIPDAAVVKRIFEEYAAGKSPKAIAFQLNKEGVSGPTGKGWGQSTINGSRQRGTGFLNNELYVGRLVWNRLRYVKDPETGKRVSRLNPEDQWIIKDVPELRIIEEQLWEKVKERQSSLNKPGKPFWAKQRPKNLFSGLVKCGACGGGYSMISQTHMGCSSARNKGTCSNRLGIQREKLEVDILTALEDHLMDPELCALFCDEYTKSCPSSMTSTFKAVSTNICGCAFAAQGAIVMAARARLFSFML